MPVKNKLLLVEDDELLRELLHELLTDDGFDVIDAYDGLEAQRLIESEVYSVILCDLMMPNMDGITFLQWLRARGIPTPVLILSGAEYPAVMEELQALGVKDCFRKPLTGEGLTALSDRLQQLVNG
ncbi:MULTISPECIES: response regulator [Gammaproteobacteria]|uniref:response regulator n=1 Tax=Gammaproteobacteria TaxID=1236 RepID=UPI00273AE41F|nr:response regulator [Marinobacter sp. MDS2]MDP4547376.1 response regulator [Marinobacter sp. MDS2]